MSSAVVVVAVKTLLLLVCCCSHPVVSQLQSIEDILETNENWSLFLEALRTAGWDLDCIGDDCDPFTVFVPTNTAMEDFPARYLNEASFRRHLRLYLRYHMLDGFFFLEDFDDGINDYPTNVVNEFLTIDVARERDSVTGDVLSTEMTINSDTFVTDQRDIGAANGVIHEIDNLLRPSVLQQNLRTVLQTIAPEFFRAFGFAGQEGLYRRIKTILAPTDEAFLQLPEDVRNDPLELAEILSYHVIGDSVLFRDAFFDGVILETVSGQVVRVSRAGVDNDDISLNQQGTVVDFNNLGSNGIIHLIDVVLSPVPVTNLFETIEGTLFGAAVEDAGVVARLRDRDDPQTVFVPSDSAMQQLSSSIRDNRSQLRNFILYHILPGRALRLDDFRDALYPTANRGNIRADYRVRGDPRVVLNGHVELTQIGREATNGIIHFMDELLLPPVDLVRTLTANGFNTFVDLIRVAQLTEAFQEEGPYTMFVPREGNYGDISALLSDRSRARQFVLSHIVREYLVVETFREQQYNTLAQIPLQIVFVDVGNGRFRIDINGRAAISAVDDVASNGIIHEVLSTVVDP